MSEFYNRYYPTICIRRAEMRAMEKLPLSEKRLMLPIVLLAPWLNSTEFENTHVRINQSIGDAKIIIDLDRFFKSSSTTQSREYFNSLISGNPEGIDEWINLFSKFENYIPVIQFKNVSDECVDKQILAARALRKGYAFRCDPINRSEFSRMRNKIEQCINDDIIFIFDFGYRDDPLATAADPTVYLRDIFNLSDTLKIVVSGSNFPNDFSDFDNFATPKEIGARVVYAELSKVFGNYQIFYGDWASTKPRRYDGGGNPPLPRIDFPTKSAWIIARSKELAWTFREAAIRITRLPEWEARPFVWGTGVIEKTAMGLPGGISTGPEAIAARVNIHLFVQNHFGDAAPPRAPEAVWVDPI